jgi:hypothetical protein
MPFVEIPNGGAARGATRAAPRPARPGPGAGRAAYEVALAAFKRDPDGSIGGLVRQVRDGKGLRLEDVAERWGKHLSVLSLVERGERRLSAAELITLALALNVPASEFFPSELRVVLAGPER